MKLAGVEEIRAMDRWAIEKLGIPECRFAIRSFGLIYQNICPGK